MQKISEKIYSRIDNDIYNKEGHRWWQADFPLNLIKTSINPFRIGYAKKIIEQLIIIDPDKLKVLDIGCGGGFLSEEIAKIGFITTGIDPSDTLLNIADIHSKENNLKISYQKATGEDLPFRDCSFDIVFCCDVMEHVHDLPVVISEISRVLKNRGIFIYDTFNRTFISKIIAIKVLQEWKRWAIMPPDLHVWEMFIKPDELRSLFEENQMVWKEHLGIKPNISYLKMLRYLHKRAVKKLSYEEFGKKFRMIECRSTQNMYMGYAIKQSSAGGDL